MYAGRERLECSYSLRHACRAGLRSCVLSTEEYQKCAFFAIQFLLVHDRISYRITEENVRSAIAHEHSHKPPTPVGIAVLRISRA